MGSGHWIHIAVAVGSAAISGGCTAYFVRRGSRRYVNREHFSSPFVVEEDVEGDDDEPRGAHRHV